MRIVKLLFVAALVGCGGISPVSPTAESAAVSGQEPAPLPSCAGIASPMHSSKVALARVGGTGLVIAYVDGRAVCKDTGEGAAAAGLVPGEPSSEPVVPPPPSSGSGGTGGTISPNSPAAGGATSPAGSGDPMPSRGDGTSSSSSGDPMPSSTK